MNNPKSTALGWGSLVAAAGISYYFAKKGINERREQQAKEGTRPTEKLDWRQRIEAPSPQDAPDVAGAGASTASQSTVGAKIDSSGGAAGAAGDPRGPK
ncbi:hypothetical protein PsYK624_110340 [Phanerochaete sordida]|uniref:Uncharacterized protein n=1 Tax=Phanerochaete sordida TaxID=48140 RepID=A0A9P3LHD6_9APHY|nr:hypothetical protein PsYK624_110340 [Phanerochaete sordida]